MGVACSILSAMLTCIVVTFYPLFKLCFLLVGRNDVRPNLLVHKLHLCQFVFGGDIQQRVTATIVSIKRSRGLIAHR